MIESHFTSMAKRTIATIGHVKESSGQAWQKTKAAGQLRFDGAPDKDRILQSITDFQGNQKRQFVNDPVGYLKS